MKLKLSEVQEFINQKSIAVAGISRNDKKFGNAIYKELKLKGYDVYPVNPNMDEYEGAKCYKSIADLPANVTAVLTCTKPNVTENIVKESVAKGIKYLWLQQGSQNENSIKTATDNNLNIVYKHCIFMFLAPVTSVHKFHRGLKKLFGGYPK